MFQHYNDTIQFLYNRLPLFSKIGAAAIKNDLHNTLAICAALDNPQHKFKTIHIAGTNGKGSSSHMLAAILQKAGYKVGLYTSPHLKDFRERIRINGEMIPETKVVEFTNLLIPSIDALHPSFFEITVGMAFQHFATEQVDVAVIETGLGGRLDSTNIITPLVSLITNIGYDHQAILGNTLEAIAKEKAGIIKENVPVVISELQPAIKHVFTQTAEAKNAPLLFASERLEAVWQNDEVAVTNLIHNETALYHLQLKGVYQLQNIKGVLATIEILSKTHFTIPKTAIAEGLANVQDITGLHGRWEILSTKPLTIADVAHNVNGMEQLLIQVNNTVAKNNITQLHIVMGMVKDKDINAVLQLLPTAAKYYFTQAQIPRAMPYNELKETALNLGLQGDSFENVNLAVAAAQEKAAETDMILICGSVFVIGELDNLTT